MSAGIFTLVADLPEPWKDEIRKILQEELSKLKVGAPEQVLSRKEAAAFLGESVRSFDRKLAMGLYPLKLQHGKGRGKKYLKSELEAFIKKS